MVGERGVLSVTASFCATETAATTTAVLSVCGARGNNKLQRRALAKCFMIVSPKRLGRAFASRCWAKRVCRFYGKRSLTHSQRLTQLPQFIACTRPLSALRDLENKLIILPHDGKQ